MTMQTASTTAPDTRAAIEDLLRQLADVDPAAVMVFADRAFDGAKITAALEDRWPGARVIGCTSAGEFTQDGTGTGGVVAAALDRRVVRRSWAGLAGFRQGVPQGVEALVHRIAEGVEADLRDLDPERWVGFVLIDGLHGAEEQVNDLLGRAAPFLSFVGGSAGDDLAFEQTRVWAGGRETDHGMAVLLVELAVPFTVVKTCSFEPRPGPFTVTRADAATRTVYELDGRPVLDVYADALGVPAADIDSDVFMRHPFGIVIDDEPWIRSPQRVVPDGGLRFYCQLPEGTAVQIMDSGDLIGDTRRALAEASEQVGGWGGAVLFNCILRRLELDARGLHPAWIETLAGRPTAGFHTYGESWLGHINQTCTGVVLGAADA